MSFDKKALQKLYDLASQKIDEGHFDEALGLAHQMQGIGHDCLISYITSGLLVDIGNAMKNVSVIEEGMKILLKDYEEIAKNIELFPSANYNLANAYLSIFEQERAKNPKLALFSKTKLDAARSYYRKAIKCQPEDKALLAQIFVNFGNCFDTLGRVVDALECYDQALTYKSGLGMALGNKGMALLNYAALSGEHQGTFVLEAHFLLTSALKKGVYPEAALVFSECIQQIERTYPKLPFQNFLGYPGYTIKARSTFEKFLVEFCLQNRLYLNVCSYCKKCNSAIGDTAVIKTMIVPAKDNSYLISSSYLNQIKQDYVAARFLLVLSRYEKMNLNFVDKRVTIINTFDNSVHNIDVQLVKIAFKTFYDILDKIAFFINDYLKLGISEREIDFTRIWYSRNKKTIRAEIAETSNLSLNALFDIHRELDCGEKKELKKTRNTLTHRFINVRVAQDGENEESMTESTLVTRTLEVAELVRNAVMYLLHFVNVEETKKHTKTKGSPLPLLAQAIPDKLKSSRRKLSGRRKSNQISS